MTTAAAAPLSSVAAVTTAAFVLPLFLAVAFAALF